MSDVIIVHLRDDTLPILRASSLHNYVVARSMKDRLVVCRNPSSVFFWLVVYASPSAWLVFFIPLFIHVPKSDLVFVSNSLDDSDMCSVKDILKHILFYFGYGSCFSVYTFGSSEFS